MAKPGSKSSNGANLGFEEKLWQAADKLRNNMDAAEYKHVVLGLIFLKYISDATKNAQAISEIMEEYLAAVGAAERVEHEIAETDQEIDERVYGLYGLGKGEIRVVGG